MQTVTLTFQIHQQSDWELLLLIIQKMNGLQLMEQKPIKTKKRNLKRFYGVLAKFPIQELTQDFNQIRNEWERNF